MEAVCMLRRVLLSTQQPYATLVNLTPTYGQLLM